MIRNLSLFSKCAIAASTLVWSLCASAQSPHQGFYTGYSYLRIEGAINQPESANGIVIAEVKGDGSIRLQDTDNVGSVNVAGTIAWAQPNDFFLTAGTIGNGTLAATGMITSGATTTYTRLDLKSGAGYSNAVSLDDYFSLVNPLNPMSGMVRVIHDGNRFVALSSTGTISISTDGTTWQTRSTGATVPLRDLAYGGGTWLAVGENNTLLTSTDLVTWTSRASGIGAIQNYHVTSAAFFKGKFYVANLVGNVARSLDSTGATWQTVSGAPGLNTNLMRTLNGRLYYTGKAGFSTTASLVSSTDGVTFTAIAFPGGAPAGVDSMAFGAGKVFLNGRAAYFTSTDGTTFTRYTSPISFGFVGFDGNRFVGRGLSGTNSGFRYSADAVNWTTGDVDALSGVVDVVSSGGVIVGVGSKGKKSTDGIVWSNITTNGSGLPATGNVGDRIVYGNGLYILHGAAGSNYITRDGVTWTGAPSHPVIAFGNGIFVSNTGSSINGSDWFPINYGLLQGESVTRIAFDGSKFLASTGQGRALVSMDGIAWSHANPGSAIFVSHTGQLAGANGEWIALGSGGAYSYSLNGGVTWATGAISNATLNAVSYGNGRWVIGANNGRIYAGSTLASVGSVGPTLTAGGGYDSVVFIDGQFFLRRDNFGTYFVSNGLSGSAWVEKTFGLGTPFKTAAVGPEFTLISGPNNYVFRASSNTVGHPVFSSQPAATTTLTQDQTLSLSAAVIGTGPFSYKWYRNGVLMTNGGRVSGADSLQLFLTDVRASDIGNYMLLAINERGSTLSKPAVLAVNLKPVVLSAPASFASAPGSNVTFTVAGSPDTTAIQWLKNGVPISGQTSATLTLTGISQSDAGFYQARLTNTFGDTLSPVASLSFRAAQIGLGPDAVFNANVPALSLEQGRRGGGFNSNLLAIRDVHSYADGKVLVGGQFGYMVGAEKRYGLIRLNADGTRDTTFNIPVLVEGSFVNGFLTTYTANVEDFAVFPDGRIVVVFGSNLNRGDGNPIPATKLMMFNADGSRVDTFPANTGEYRAVAVDSQDRIIFGGVNLAGSGSTVRHIARYNVAGVLDATFDGKYSVIGIATIPPKCLVIGENDSLLTAGIDSNGRTATRKLTSSGTLMPGFSPSSFEPVRFESPNTVYSIDLLPNGDYFVSGNFVTINFVPWKQVARFSSNGTLDQTYKLGESYKGVTSLGVAVLPDKDVLLTGVGYSFDGSFSPGQYLGGLIQTGPTAILNEAASRQLEANAQVSQFTVSTVTLSSDKKSVYAGRIVSSQNNPNAFRFAKLDILNGALPGAPTLAITGQTPGAYAEPGDRVTFAVSAVGGGLKFQWRKNGVNISDEIGTSLTLSPITVADAGSYSVVVTDGSGSVSSAVMPLTVPGAPVPVTPTFTSWKDQYVFPPGLDGFHQDASGDGVSNGFKYVFDLNPLISAPLQLEVAPPSGNPKPTGSSVIAFNTAAGLSSLGVEAGKTYQIVSFRLPADLKGTGFEVQPTTGLVFGDGSAIGHPYGQPVADGGFLIHSVYLTPATEDAGTLFWRLALYP